MDEDRPHFSVFGVPVRVRWTFAITVLLGMQSGLRSGVEWAAIVFVSVLLHELGHAFVGRAFGLRPTIELYAFGGQTGWIGGKPTSSGKNMLISLAGPAVSVGLGVAGFVLGLALPKSDLVNTFWYVNALWGVFNLLPIMPMDGGNALRSFLLMLGLRKTGEIGTRLLSIVLAAPIAIYAATHRLEFFALFLLMFAASNVQSLVRYLRNQKDNDLFDGLRAQYPEWMQKKDGKSMIAAALRARKEAQTDYLRGYATEILAMGQCIDGDARSALATLETSMPPGMMPGLPIYLHILFEAGETERATSLAHQIMQQGDDEMKQQAAAALASRQPAIGTA